MPSSISLERTEIFGPLFPGQTYPVSPKQKRFRQIERPIWSHNKAQFIAKYLHYFVQITKHGAYIDGFSGPQYSQHLEVWTASQVLASRPKWLRQFFLCELDAASVKLLENLRSEQLPIFNKLGQLQKRQISIHAGDFNVTVDRVLKNERLTQKEATFCLLDQRTFECHWSTVEKLAAYKRPGNNKIELLYLVGVGWLHRAMSGLSNEMTMQKWWGREDWKKLPSMPQLEIANTFRARFAEELGYKYTAAYPIFDSDEGNRVMYYMVHASDHDEAQTLMVRAHQKAVRSLPADAQSEMWTAGHLASLRSGQE